MQSNRALALQMLKYYDMEQMRDRLVITVKKELDA